MPSRKQRRRREKLQRHEWEFVEYDEEGNEVMVEPAPAKKEKPKQAQAKQSNGKPTSRSGRPIRAVKPPSWNRSMKRAMLFVPFLFIFLSLGKHPPSLPIRIAVSLAYAAVFVPMFYFVDRLSYRAYLKRIGESPDQA